MKRIDDKILLNVRLCCIDRGDKSSCDHGRPAARERTSVATVVPLFIVFLLFFGVLGLRCFTDAFTFSGALFAFKKAPKKVDFTLLCSNGNTTTSETCPSSSSYPKFADPIIDPTSASCPDYFRWIHEDLRPWKESGITRETMEEARQGAHFRLAIVGGKAYVERYKKSFQTRDVFTLWGILQLLRFYPGRLPDLELMFNCNDSPIIRRGSYSGPDVSPPPLFRYCSEPSSVEIVFPDWTFWGWVETNIKPWKDALKDMKEGNERIKWKDRVPYAFWRGNPYVARTRGELMKCNLTSEHDWKALLYKQDWSKEAKQGYKQSNLADQCIHRYKIYIEGWAWSVSEKYILACDSMTLYIKSRFHDFFSRGMIPLQHYWPIKTDNKCPSLKFAVEWGNNHTNKAQAIGKEGSRFVQEELKMELVYDYMFHVLSEYAKLLRFKPTVPKGAVELCSEVMACPANGVQKKFLLDSLVRAPSNSLPCAMPLPYHPQQLKAFLDKKDDLARQVEVWEDGGEEK